MRYLDRILSALLLLGAAGHTFGVIGYYRGQTDALFWALSETLLVVLLAAVNLLRSDRPQDRGLAWVATAASASYIPFLSCSASSLRTTSSTHAPSPLAWFRSV